MVTSLKVVMLPPGPLPDTPTWAISTPVAAEPSVTVTASPLAGVRQAAPLSRRSSSLAWHTETTRFGEGRPLTVTDAVATPAGSMTRMPLSDSSEFTTRTSVRRKVRLVAGTVVPPDVVGTALVASGGRSGAGSTSVSVSSPPLPPPHPAATAVITNINARVLNRRTGAGYS